MQPLPWRLGTYLAGLLALASTAMANEVLVNVDPAGSQMHPAVAHQSTGEAFIVWEGPDGILGRRFGADGNPMDPTDLLISEDGHLPHVDMNDSGQAVVVWQTQEFGNSSEVMARLVPFDGSPASEIFMVNVVDAGSQQDAGVNVLPNGDFFVVYESATLDGSQAGIALRHFDAGGNPLSDEQVVNTNQTQDHQTLPNIAHNSSGAFVVSWYDSETGDSYLRFFHPTGLPATDPIESVRGFDHRLAYSDNGRVLLVAGLSNGLVALFDTQGTLLFGPVPLDEDDQEATRPTATALANGDFQVTWTRAPNFGGPKDVYTRRVLADGTFPDPPHRAHRQTVGNQDRAHIDASPNNDYTIVFFGPDSDGTGVYATCLQPDGCVEVFVDGFESGDVTRWSGSTP